MIIDFTKKVIDEDGKEKEAYSEFARRALYAPNLTNTKEQNMDSYKLAERIKNEQSGMEVSFEVAEKIKDAVHLLYHAPVLDTRFYELFLAN